MPNVSRNPRQDTLQVIQSVLAPQKIHQAIFAISIATTPTKAQIRFSTVFDGVAFVTLFQNGGQIAGAFAFQLAPSNYAVSFTGLPQNTELGLRIDVTDPRPQGEQLPGGIVSYSSLVETGLRTASVRLRNLREIQGEAEMTFVTRLYDWDGVEGDQISAQLQYGRGHMDPAGNPIGDPFGPALLFPQAPDAIAIYTLAQAYTAGLSWGLGVMGMKLPDTFPNDAPRHVVGDGSDETAAQTIVALPDAEGPYHVPFSYASGLFDYMFEVHGWIDGDVTAIIADARQFMMLPPQEFGVSVALPASPRATVACGDVLRSFQLTVDGGIARLRDGARRQTDLERLGDLVAARLVAAGRTDGAADLLALAPDWSLHHARAGKKGPVAWRRLGIKLAAEPAVVRAPGGGLHVFGVEAGGALAHAMIPDKAVAPQWERRWDGLAPRVSCACGGSGEAHLFARRKGALVRADFELGDGPLKLPRYETISAPFAGPATVGAVGDGRVAVIGCDDRRVFWIQTRNGRRWEKNWRRVGTIDALFPKPKAKDRKRPAARAPASRAVAMDESRRPGARTQSGAPRAAMAAAPSTSRWR
jgi:hypothetical protein